jgi:hypothetical protein
MKPEENEFLGVTDDFIWYEVQDMGKQLNTIAGRLQDMERVVKARSRETFDYVHFLQKKMQELKAEVESLRSKE